jgi:hypothetical protein
VEEERGRFTFSRALEALLDLIGALPRVIAAEGCHLSYDVNTSYYQHFVAKPLWCNNGIRDLFWRR